MLIANNKELSDFFNNSRRATTTAQTNIARIYAFVRAWRAESASPPVVRVITIERIVAECDRASGVDCTYGIEVWDDDPTNPVEIKLYLIKKGEVAFVRLDSTADVSDITQEIEEPPY